jgi:hypothetical protein
MTIEFNPQISQITQITMNVRWRMRNLPGLIPRSLLRSDRSYQTWIPRGLPRGGSFSDVLGFDPTLIVIPVR